jgi:hypothetical protein
MEFSLLVVAVCAKLDQKASLTFQGLHQRISYVLQHSNEGDQRLRIYGR